MPHTNNDNAANTDDGQFLPEEQEIVHTLNAYLKMVDDIDPALLADRPCIDLNLDTNGR